jgi:NADH-quinone oxidoreductase subunit B
MSGGWITTKLNYVIGWGRKFSLFHYPFITACCGMEYMSTACAHWDFDRFGCGLTTFLSMSMSRAVLLALKHSWMRS